MSRREHFSVILVRGDGTRVFRLTLRRPFLTALAVITTVGLATGLMGAELLDARRITRQAPPHVEQIAEQRATLAAVQTRIADLRREVASWRNIHTRLFEAFGPDGTPASRDRSIGGPATPVDRMPGHLTPYDELQRLADSIAEEGQNLRLLDTLMSRAGKMLAAVPTRWPVRGAVNSEFGARQSPWSSVPEFHAGIDIRAEPGTSVEAPAGGTVAVAGPHAEYGLTVVLDHGNDIRSVYAHLSRVRVRVGQIVQRGAELGLTGSTGRSSGPHLHYEILVKGESVNPRRYLWE